MTIQPENNPQKLPQAAVPQLPPELEKAISKLPKENRPAMRAILTSQTLHFSQSSSPIPPPEEMQKYAEIIPTAPERILKNFEDQVAHRMAIEKMVIPTREAINSRGQWLGFFIAVWGLTVSGFIAYSGHGTAAGVIGGGSLATIVLAFTGSKSIQERAIAAKRNPQ